MRLLSPDDKCVQADVPIGFGLRYTGKTIDVSDPAHARALRKIGYTVADVTGAPSKAAGFSCDCGFKSYFRLCSRCGSEYTG